MQAVVKAGAARIAISTGGASPRVGAILKAALEAALDGTFARFLERMAERRRDARAQFPDDPERRRAAMRAAAAGFEANVRVEYPHWFRDERG